MKKHEKQQRSSNVTEMLQCYNGAPLHKQECSVNFSTERRVKLMKLELKTFTAKLRFLHRPKRFCLCYLPVGTFGRLGKFWFPS